MKYKVGDKVRIRGDLEVDENYGEINFLKNMVKGKICDVMSVSENEVCELNDAHEFYYSPEMLRPAEFKIWCETEEEKRAVLEELEKEGYVWVNGGEKPTEWNGVFDAQMYFYVINGEFCQGKKIEGDKPEIPPSEFTGIDFSEKIIITKTPTGATAIYGDKTVTTEGDFEGASRQALTEVLCPYRVGDRVIDKRCKRDGIVTNVRNVCEVFVHFEDGEDDMAFKTLELLKPYEPLYSAKLFCIKGSEKFEQGMIYSIKNGSFPKYPWWTFKNLDDINGALYAQFMEVKGGLDD